MSCPLCWPAVKDQQHVLFMESEHCVFTAIHQPVLIGSGLIVPKQHRETVFDLTPEEVQDTFELLKQVKKKLDDRYRPQGYNIGWNCYETGGQEIAHAHLHVIPRYADEPLAGKGIRYHLKQPTNKRKSL